MQGAEPWVLIRRGPSAWRRCKEGKSGSSALVGRRVAAITIHSGKDLRVALVVRVRTFSALGAAGLF